MLLIINETYYILVPLANGDNLRHELDTKPEDNATKRQEVEELKRSLEICKFVITLNLIILLARTKVAQPAPPVTYFPQKKDEEDKNKKKKKNTETEEPGILFVNIRN
jgi:hypothetical protein